MTSNPYIQDILSEAESLRAALRAFSAAPLASLARRFRNGEFSNVVLTGMGASYCAAYPAWLRLTATGVPVSWVETSEVLHYSPGLVTPRSLLVAISQSGYSAEIQSLVANDSAARPAALLGVTNDLESPLARRADLALPIHAGPEHTVSTRTYLNTLSTLLLTALELSGDALEPARASLLSAADGVEAYLLGWQSHVADLKARVGLPKTMFILGRGASMAAVMNGSLVLKEAAKVAYEGMSTPYFRHGPLELAGPELFVWMFAGGEKTRQLNRDLAVEVKNYGGRVLWVDSQADPELDSLVIPKVDEIARPLVEILPLQLYSLAAAELNGIEAGAFRHIGKVTLKE